MSQANVDIVKSAYEAFGRGDIPYVLSLMAQDVVWNEAENFPYADGNPYIGPDAILNGVLARVGSEWDNFAVAPDEIVDGGDTVIMLGRYKGAYKATGVAINAQAVHVFKLREGKIVSFQQYVDTAQIRDAVAKRAGA